MKKDGSGVICITDPSASSNDFYFFIFIKEKQNKTNCVVLFVDIRKRSLVNNLYNMRCENFLNTA